MVFSSQMKTAYPGTTQIHSTQAYMQVFLEIVMLQDQPNLE